MIGLARRELDRWLFDEYSVGPRSLGLFRILFAAYLFGAQAPPLLAHLARYPDVFFDPPLGFMQLFGGLPPAGFFWALYGCGLLANAALLLGWRTAWASVACTALMLLAFGFSYSFGKIDHNVPIVILPLAMAWSGWGSAFSLDALRRRTFAGPVLPSAGNPSLAILALLVGFMMWTAAVPKLVGGWLHPEFSAVRGYLIANVHGSGQQQLLAHAATAFNSHVFWELADWYTVLLEFAFLPAVLRLRTFRWCLAGACLFHLGILLILNIPSAGFVLVYAAFFNWEALAERFGSRSDVLAEKSAAAPGLLVPVVAVLGGLLGWGLARGWDVVGVALGCQGSLLGALVIEVAAVLSVAAWLLRGAGTDVQRAAASRRLRSSR